MPLFSRPQRERSPRTLAALCSAAAGGDESAFAELHGRLSGALRRFFASRHVGANDCDELVQRTWIGVWEAIRGGRYDPQRAAITTFAYAVAYKMWLQHLRRAKSADAHAERNADADTTQSLFEYDEPSAFMRTCELLDAVRACIRARSGDAALDPAERAIVEGIGRNEPERAIAVRLGLAASTVNVRKRSALDKLRKCLAHKGFTSIAPERQDGFNE